MGKRLYTILGAIVASATCVAVATEVKDLKEQDLNIEIAKENGIKWREPSGIYEKYVKRPLDATLATGAMVILSPILFITGGMVRYKLGSPVIFKQQRPGLIDSSTGKERIFTLYKFRTMTDDRDSDGNLLPDSERLTKFGAWLRSTSIDELPELFNIINGDMAVIGPRPQLVRDMVFMSDEQRKRHTVRPGLSGLAQIRGRNAIGWEQKLSSDLEYIQNINLKNDARIVLITIGKVLKKEGISEDEQATALDYGDQLLKDGVITQEEYDKKQEEARKLLNENKSGFKKVLIVASVISFIEWFNKENIEFLRNDLGCEVHIACNFDYMDDTDVERTIKYINALRSEGIILHNINFERSPINKKNAKAYNELKKIIDGNHFDLIHCHTPVASALTRLAARSARKNGTVVMYTCHGFHFHNSAPRKNWVLYYPVERELSRFCDYIITINNEDFLRAKTFFAPNVRYIPGVGVDIRRIQTAKVNKRNYKKLIGIPDDAFMILSVGEMIERKNHQVIIRALGKLKKLGSVDKYNIYYVICGKGPLKDELKRIAVEESVEDRVLFLGFRTDIPELCNIADISAFPSRVEGLGIAGIEAMAAGVPLVSSNVHGILDYVTDGVTGFTCNPDDIDGFAKSIDALVKNNELRETMKINCYNAVEPFEIKNALREMWNIYKEVLS